MKKHAVETLPPLDSVRRAFELLGDITDRTDHNSAVYALAGIAQSLLTQERVPDKATEDYIDHANSLE